VNASSEISDRLRIAVLGAGTTPRARARQYLSTIARLTDHYELCAVCDRDSSLLQEVSDEYPIESCFTNIRSLFEAQRPDVVLSLTPKDSHIVTALTAARHGAHVLTEIPVALTRRYADAIARTCMENGVLWEIAEQVWLWPRERLKQRIVERELLGKVSHARLSYLTGQYHGFSGIRALLEGNADRVLGYVGEVETEPYVAYGGEAESSIQWESGIIEFSGGATCLFEKPPRIFPSSAHAYPTGWQIEGPKGHLTGDRLTLYRTDEPLDLLEHFTNHEGERVLEAVRVETDPPVVWENPFIQYGIGSPDDVSKASILTGFHDAIVRGTNPPYGVINGLKDYELCLAIRESARRNNQWISLPLGEPTDLERQIEREFVRRYGHDPIEETDALLDTPFGRSATLWPFAHWL
tara:strand:- start:10185 stop:11414 length:1230 start_codon:yes stop_codon:yes gene_type:complete